MAMSASPEDILLYNSIMSTLSFEHEEHLFIVRLWDGMDGCWCDCTEAVLAKEALRIWKEHTENGTKKICFNEIDYYRIFPAETQMV